MSDKIDIKEVRLTVYTAIKNYIGAENIAQYDELNNPEEVNLERLIQIGYLNGMLINVYAKPRTV